MSKWNKRTIWIILLITFAVGGFISFSKWDNRRLLRGLLNISELPKSIETEECKSCALSDVISVCRFKIDPKDTAKIIAAYPYKEDASILPYVRSSCGGVGSPFEPATAWVFVPPEFKHGGWIRLFLSKDGTQGLIDYYEE